MYGCLIEEEWDWGEAGALATLFDSAESAVNPATVPRREWRARLQGRIDASLGWLDKHDIRSNGPSAR